jgi:GNAT superfamily N-acetyltransferase
MANIMFKTMKKVSARSVQDLFRRMEYSDWFTLKDVEWYLSHAVFVVSAWHGRKLVGLGVLTGDGRTELVINTMLVDAPYQRQGIGTQMLERMLKKVDDIKPYWCQVGACNEFGEKLYRKFGFTDGGPTMLNHEPTSKRWTARADREREERRGKSGRAIPQWRR